MRQKRKVLLRPALGLHIIFALVSISVVACEDPLAQREVLQSSLPLEEMAKIISDLPLEKEHLYEVFDAVNSSSSNGYDEEYMMSDLLSSPGAGVGDKASKAPGRTYTKPLRELLSEYVSNSARTKAGAADAQAFLDNLEESDIQIYWPYSEYWDGETFPIISFDPGNGAESNYGYLVDYDGNGLKIRDSVIVDEGIAMERPVWVINRNDDASFTPLKLAGELSEYPSSLSGQALILPEQPLSLFEQPMGEVADNSCVLSSGIGSYPLDNTKATDTKAKALYINSFKMHRNFDSWFGGASEFFIKCGAVNGFRASNESDLKLYSPAITDLMIVVKRSQCGLTIPVNALLLSEFTEQMDKLAFLIIEDDGGDSKSWKCSAVVKINSKSYGFEMEIPYRDHDDIVWRGQLSRSFFGDERMTTANLGGVSVYFEQK